jgi:sulfite reductase beta subunit-like hemoprotein
VRINISGCTNSCGQHHAADIGFFGAERRAHGRSAPGYQMLLGGYVGQEQIHFGDKATRLPAKAAPQAAVRVVRRFADERRPASRSARGWTARAVRRRSARR